MKEELIKEAVVLLKEYLDTDASLSAAKTEIKTIIDLAEKVLAIGGKMPEKDKTPRCACDGWNMAIDQCVLAFAGMGLSVDEMIGFAAQGYCTKRNEKKELDAELIEDICYAIHKAWEGKF